MLYFIFYFFNYLVLSSSFLELKKNMINTKYQFKEMKEIRRMYPINPNPTRKTKSWTSFKNISTTQTAQMNLKFFSKNQKQIY